MASSSRLRFVFLCLVNASFGVLLFILNDVAYAGERLVNEILAARAEEPQTIAKFKQTVTSPLLTEPQESRGTLHYAKPDLLMISITSPFVINTEIRGDEMVFTQGKKTRSIDLENQPGLGGYLRAIRWLLQGDKTSLLAHYALSADGDMQSWMLLMSPLVEDEITSIVLRGRSSEVNQILIDKLSGDQVLLQMRNGQSGS